MPFIKLDIFGVNGLYYLHFYRSSLSILVKKGFYESFSSNFSNYDIKFARFAFTVLSENFIDLFSYSD